MSDQRVFWSGQRVVTINSDGGTSGWTEDEAARLYRDLGAILDMTGIVRATQPPSVPSGPLAWADGQVPGYVPEQGVQDAAPSGSATVTPEMVATGIHEMIRHKHPSEGMRAAIEAAFRLASRGAAREGGDNG